MILRGNRRAVFEHMGRKFSKDIDELVTAIVHGRLQSKITKNSNLIKESMQLAKNTAPEVWEDLEVLAFYSGIEVDNLFFLNCMVDITDLPDSSDGRDASEFQIWREGCTTIWNGSLLAQNLDLDELYKNKMVIVVLEDVERPQAFVTYAGGVAGPGFNCSGVGVLGNKLYSRRTTTGLVYPVYFRTLLRKNSLDEALKWALKIQTMSGRNLVVADSEGKMANIEFAADFKDVTMLQSDIYAHTNFYMSRKLSRFEREQPEYETVSNNKRLETAERELGKTNMMTAWEAEKILSLHGDYGKGSGICTHGYHGGWTCATAIMDLKKRIGWFHLTNPCHGQKTVVDLS